MRRNEVVGGGLLNRIGYKAPMKYHWADRNGRLYLCGCAGSFRVADRIKHGFSNRIVRSRMSHRFMKSFG